MTIARLKSVDLHSVNAVIGRKNSNMFISDVTPKDSQNRFVFQLQTIDNLFWYFCIVSPSFE